MPQQPPYVTPLIESAFLLARAKYATEHTTWTELSGRLAGRASLMPMMISLQRVGDLDLMLRALEDERLAVVTSEPAHGFADHYQLMLSEAWVVACYEILRALHQRERETAAAAQAKDPHYIRDDVSSLETFGPIFADFELLRMPMAKYEIAKDDKMKRPLVMRAVEGNGDAPDDRLYDRADPARSHVMPNGLSPRGSVAWLVLDHRVPREYWVERRNLSDRLLRFKDDVEPAGLREARLAAEARTGIASEQ